MPFSASFGNFRDTFAKPPCTEQITAGSVKTDEENSILRKLTNQVLPKLPKKLATPKSDCCDANVAWLGATRWHDSGNFDRFTEGYVWVHDYLHPGSRVTTGPGRGQADITGRLYQAACRPPVYSFLESFDCFHRGDPMKKFQKKNFKIFSKT